MAKGKKTGGRKAGTPNKITGQLKDMILGALEAKGGMDYLTKVAQDHPQVFCALLGRVLPIQQEHTGKDGAPLTVIQRLNVPKQIGPSE